MSPMTKAVSDVSEVEMTNPLQVMARAIGAESACIDIEDRLFCKVLMDYLSRFP